MKRAIILFSLYIITAPVFAQQIVNMILVGDNGITEDIRQARSFICIKQYPGTFQRSDYGLGSPLKKVRNYSDSNLAILEGAYYEYSFNGTFVER